MAINLCTIKIHYPSIDHLRHEATIAGFEFEKSLYRFLNGESGLDVYNRAADFIVTMFRDFSNPSLARKDLNIVVLTHGLTMHFLMR